MTRRPRAFVINTPRQLATLAHPSRQRLVDDLAGHGPSSVAETAGRLGRRPEGLYYHVRALLKAGLIVLDKKRRAGRRWEAVYRLVAPRLKIDRKLRSKSFIRAQADLCAVTLRALARDYRAALESGAFAADGPRQNLLLRRHITRLNADELRRLNRYLAGIAALLEKSKPPRTGNLYGLTVVLTPLNSPGDQHADDSR
jgi:hypothetical protein